MGRFPLDVGSTPAVLARGARVPLPETPAAPRPSAPGGTAHRPPAPRLTKLA
ncbi:hypothetical protein [Streptomyces sp. NPDC002328]|uniref:hypothetical protein n=1 Tax=Streptomyces sp. NPDC002328 TaxID=3364642 RepID=UPI00367B40FB